MNDTGLVELICKLIESKPLLQYLDFSWSKLQPKHMKMLSESLNANPNKVRNLNFSYNTLKFDPTLMMDF